MAIPPIQLPDLKLPSLSDEDRAALDSFLSQIISIVNDLIKIVNTNHP